VDWEERFVAAVMGALWGSFLGLMIAMALALVRPLTGNDDYLAVNWLYVIAGCGALFSVLGLVFKASIATVIGELISWTYARLIQRSDPADGLPWWVQLLFYVGLAALAYWFF
jgi:hypothetical protein